MNLDAEELKLKVKTKARENNVQPQDIMQMYFFERLLYRISISKYKNNFILKGGLLLSAIFGDDRRTTQDMDTMIKGIPLDSNKIVKIVEEITDIVCDNISFKIVKTKEIRLNDKYKGIKVSLVASMQHLLVPLSIDITAGDPITPCELEYKYKSMFDDSYITIMAFNLETVIAEKFETLITDNVMNTRTKDFYDLHIIITKFYENIDKDILILAIKNTFKRRNVVYDVEKIRIIFDLIKKNQNLMAYFNIYKCKRYYVKNISYDDVMNSIYLIIELLLIDVTVSQ